MTNPAFQNLREAVVQLLTEKSGKPVPPPASAEGNVLNDLDTVALAIDGVVVMLTYHEAVRNDRAFVFTSFGAIPPEIEVAAMRRLLDINFLLYQGNAPAFARDPESGHVMLLGEIPLATATPEAVLSYMRELSRQALEWRKTFFLSDAGAHGMDSLAARI